MWKVHSEEKDHFVVHGNSGPFRIGKQNLSEGGLVKLRSFLQGKKKKPGTTEEMEANEIDEEQGFAQGTPDVPVENADFAPPRENVNPAVPQYETAGSAPRQQPSAADLRTDETGFVDTDAAADAVTRPIRAAASTILPLDNPADHSHDTPAPQPPRPAEPPPDSLAVRPGEPGGPSIPHQQPQPQGGQDFRMPPMPPMTDLTRVAGEAQEAQERGGRAADTLQQAESQQAQAMTGLYQEHLANIKALNDKTTSELQSIQARNDKMQADLMDPKSDIKPEHFWSEKSTFQKVVAGLGMMLSGIGSGLSGQPNMAADFIQKAINRDIEAQKANLGKKESALSYGMKLYGNHVMAADYARGMLTNTLAAAVGMEGARTGDLRARAQAEMTKSQLAQAALAPQLQIATIRHQDQMMRMQMEFQRQMFGLASGQGGGGGQGYVPSGTPAPMPGGFDLKAMSEWQKAKGDARVSIPIGDKSEFTYSSPTRAREQEAALAHINTMEKALNTMQRIGRDNAWAINSPLPNASKVEFDNAAHALDLGMGGLSNITRFTSPEDAHYRQIVGKRYNFLLGDTGEANINAIRKTMIVDKRQRVFDELGGQVAKKYGGRQPETPVGAR